MHHFQIGARVVCVDMTSRGDGLDPRYPGTVLPVLGGDDEPGLLLAEVVNPVRSYTCKTHRLVRVEQFWLGYRFRPLRTTNIDVFTAMLAPLSPAPAELVDA